MKGLTTRDYVFNVTRAEVVENQNVIEGYFVVFNEPTKLYGEVFEEIAPEAFDETLGNDIRALWNHSTQHVIGRTRNGTLQFTIDSKGLLGRVVLPDTTYAKDMFELIKKGYVNQCSFGFNILDEEMIQKQDIATYRIKKIDLHEVSVVTFPAYENTSVEARERARAESITRNKAELKKQMEKLKEVLK